MLTTQHRFAVPVLWGGDRAKIVAWVKSIRNWTEVLKAANQLQSQYSPFRDGRRTERNQLNFQFYTIMLMYLANDTLATMNENLSLSSLEIEVSIALSCYLLEVVGVSVPEDCAEYDLLSFVRSLKAKVPQLLFRKEIRMNNGREQSQLAGPPQKVFRNGKVYVALTTLHTFGRETELWPIVQATVSDYWPTLFPNNSNQVELYEMGSIGSMRPVVVGKTTRNITAGYLSTLLGKEKERGVVANRNGSWFMVVDLEIVKGRRGKSSASKKQRKLKKKSKVTRAGKAVPSAGMLRSVFDFATEDLQSDRQRLIELLERQRAAVRQTEERLEATDSAIENIRVTIYREKKK